MLCNALFFSLAAGMFVSALSRDTQKAMTGTLALCGVFLLALPLVDWCLAGWDTTKFVPLLSLGSPAYPFTVAGNSRPQGFWAALIISHAIGWGLLMTASVLAQSMWQEKPSSETTGAGSRPHRWRFGGPAIRARLRRELLHPNPIRWLAGRDRWVRLGLWAFLGAAVLFLFLLDVAVTQREVVMGLAYGLCWLAALLLKIWLASQAARFFVEGLENGTLELLLVSPVRPEEIVRGQGWALRRTFLLPAVILLAGNGMMGLAQVYEMMNTMRASAATAAPASVTVTMVDQVVWNQLISLVGGLITFVTGLWAVAWFGMWMGLTSRKVHVAVIKTLVFVQVLPTFALMLVQGLLMFGAAFNQWPFWIGSIVTVVLTIGVHVAFALGSRRALLGNLRQRVAEPERRGTWRRPFGKLR
ncbi:MAG: hypothetical protein HYZ36_02465 [Pedosphaera parvula]|nr:hypothetical protein [Pedosphaera parvula]